MSVDLLWGNRATTALLCCTNIYFFYYWYITPAVESGIFIKQEHNVWEIPNWLILLEPGWYFAQQPILAYDRCIGIGVYVRLNYRKMCLGYLEYQWRLPFQCTDVILDNKVLLFNRKISCLRYVFDSHIWTMTLKEFVHICCCMDIRFLAP